MNKELEITPLQVFELTKSLTFLTLDELRTLYGFLSHQYINYEDIALMEVVRKISQIVNSES